MDGRGVDRRVKKTKKQLRQALMDLMTEKPSKSISVRELAERADTTAAPSTSTIRTSTTSCSGWRTRWPPRPVPSSWTASAPCKLQKRERGLPLSFALSEPAYFPLFSCTFSCCRFSLSPTLFIRRRHRAELAASSAAAAAYSFFFIRISSLPFQLFPAVYHGSPALVKHRRFRRTVQHIVELCRFLRIL